MHLSISKGRLLPALAVSVALLFAANAPSASANSYPYCGQVLNPSAYCNSAVWDYLRELNSSATASGSVCVKAFYLDGSDYGSYACGTGVAVHCYAGLWSASGRTRNDGAAAHYYDGNLYTNLTTGYC